MCVIPLFISLYVGVVLGLVAWGYLQMRRPAIGDILTWNGTGILLALLLLAVFTTGIFMAYVVLDIGF